MKKMILGLLMLQLFAAGSSSAAASKIVEIKIAGMICDFCAKAMEKTFQRSDEVETMSIDREASLVTLVMKDGQTISDEVIIKQIADSGYNVETIARKEDPALE